MGDFSSYYKYEKFEVLGDELIPLGIYSIDADGTMPYVVKKECDTACGCIEPQYRWIQTEDTICVEVLTQTVSGSPYCVGFDRYEDVYSQVSYDNGVTWETTATTSTLIEENSSACGYVPPTPTTEYRWVDDGGTTCVGVDKYNRKVKQVSYDGGSTWMNVSPLTVSATTLVEVNSPDCGYIAPQYRTISGDPYCNGVDKYEDVYSQVSYDGGSSWETTATTSTLIQAKSADCGYAERTISGTPYCDGADLVVVTSAQTSSDSGSTWTTVSTAITMVESGSSQCHQTVHVTGVTLNKNSMSLNSGSSETLVATVSPSNADDKSVTWSSNNTSVATVNSSGLVSAVTSGSATITVTTTDGGYTAQCSVSVSVPTPPTPTIDGKFILTLSDSSTVSAECDSTSAITTAETYNYHLDIISATIGDCVTTIGDEAFNNCMTLTSVTIPNSVTTIGNNAFNGCDLYGISLPGTLINLGDGAFKYCQYLQDVNIPVGYVPNECFSHCPNLKDVDFSFNTTTIDFGAFSSCYSLESIDIPSAIESINYEAFKNCENLASVYVHATTPPTLRNDSFDGTPIADGTGTIYVPAASVNAYKAASGWSTYASQIQAIP